MMESRTRRQGGKTAACSAAIIVALAAAAPTAGEHPRVTSFPPDWPHAAPWKLNRELLLPESERILFVVDAPRGVRQPDRESLDHLVQLAASYARREARWVRLGQPEAPNVRWNLPSEPRDPLDIILRVRDDTEAGDFDIPQDALDAARYLAEVPSCPDGPLAEDASYVFVRYLGQWGRSYGSAREPTPDPSCGVRTFPVICLAQDRIARDRAPMISQSYLERRALAHEYGHILGLPSNPVHGRWECTLPYKGGAHCVHRDCAVAVPTAKALLKGQMLDYCTDCQRDIETAREHWLTGKIFPDVARLPQPDPVAHVARLKNYNFRAEGAADQLLGYGKAAVPPLMERLLTLPGEREGSPRFHAAHLVVEIILAEDRKRQERAAAAGLRQVRHEADLSEGLIDWWSLEAAGFMSGDGWSLPEAVLTRD